MPYLEQEFNLLAQEHVILLRHYGGLQQHCTQQARTQMREIERLQGEIIRLRALAIKYESALAWEREEYRDLLAAPAERPAHAMAAGQEAGSALAQGPLLDVSTDSDGLEDSLRCADLVICQTGCLSHGAFWRVEDHCKRTGKACVLVEQPGALRIVRIHTSGQPLA